DTLASCRKAWSGGRWKNIRSDLEFGWRPTRRKSTRPLSVLHLIPREPNDRRDHRTHEGHKNVRRRDRQSRRLADSFARWHNRIDRTQRLREDDIVQLDCRLSPDRLRVDPL